MAKFFVGQRVKKVRGEQNVGLTGRVIGLGRYTHGNNGIRLMQVRDLEVRFDTVWVNADGTSMPSSTNAFSSTVFFEPILPEGAQPSTWDACLWQPEDVSETV